jgi:hypothetical protein
MLSYLDKFNNLDSKLRDSISSPSTLNVIEEIENKYGVGLASVVMRVMVKEISIVDLNKFFVFEFGLDGRTADELVEELKEKVFLGVADYLGFVVAENEVVADQAKFDQWTQNKNTEAEVRGSSFFFSPEDEEEVRELAKKLETYTTSPAKAEIKKGNDDTELKIDQVCKQLRISFSSEELNSRFRKVISTYIKGVRNIVDTKQTLTKIIDDGGLSMDPIYVDNILLVVDKINADFVSPVSVDKKPEVKLDNFRNLQQVGARDMDYDFNDLAKRTAAKEKKAEDQKAGEDTSLHFVDESVTEASESKKEKVFNGDNGVIDLTKFETKEVDVDQNSQSLPKDDYSDIITKANKNIADESGHVTMPNNMASARRAAIDDKSRMNDVKYVPKLTSPVSELGELDLINFRRLDAKTEYAADKIKQKIKNLEEENYAKRLSGIKSWRQSPINKLYLEIGQESLAKKKSVSEIIEERASQGEEYLTEEEFVTIMALNKDLKY